MSETEFDVRDFRRTLGQFPTGVTVITTIDDNAEPVGVTASSFNSVSVDPPLILWSVDKSAFSAPIFEKATHFAVNVLGKDQVDISNKFAGRGEDKFAGVDYTQSNNGSPLLNTFAAQFECETWNVYEGGDHLIIVGKVINYQRNESIPPLVFSRGSYAVSMQHPTTLKPSSEGLPESVGEFLSNYMLYLLHIAFTRYGSQLYPQLMEECGVTAEEWRVLTLLSGTESTDTASLSNVAMQPVNELIATTDWMKEKGLLIDDSGQLRLSETGLALQQQLMNIAKSHEVSVLEGLSQEQRLHIKSSLQQLCGMV